MHKYTEQQELEAWWFAAELLMPSEEFERFFLSVKGDIYKTARHFCVSVSAALIRAEALGILPEPESFDSLGTI